jgi:hypothetical protein
MIGGARAMPIRRIYSETLPYEDLVRPRTLDLLARYELELVLAVRPWHVRALPEVARAVRGAGVPMSIWPMLADEEGRWASVHNAPAFGRLTLSIVDALEASRAEPRDVLFDLEPPFAQARTLAHVGASRAAFDAASRTLARTVETLRARGIATSMAVWPLVALDPPGGRGWQSLLGTPVDPLGAAHVSVMVYTSILEGWSRGALRRAHTTALLSAASARAVRRWGAAAGISLGCVGTGAFEDEPTYRDPSELAEDASVARAAGCEELTLFDLGGVVARAPAEAWLDAFTARGGKGRAPAIVASRRVRAARTIARAATWALGWSR